MFSHQKKQNMRKMKIQNEFHAVRNMKRVWIVYDEKQTADWNTKKGWVIMLALIVADCDAADENSPESIKERPDTRKN